LLYYTNVVFESRRIRGRVKTSQFRESIVMNTQDEPEIAFEEDRKGDFIKLRRS